MKAKKIAQVVTALTLILSAVISSKAQAMNDEPPLNAKQQGIVTIAAFTASGEMDRLAPALNGGLDAGLTVNEIKEILVQMYAYAGFPRSLNAMFALMSTLEERQSKGITDKAGRDASPLPSDLNRDEYGAKIRAKLSGLDHIPPPAEWQKFSPTIDTFLKEHLFADIFARDILDHQQRELATIAALANIPGTEGQLRYHLGAAMNVGLSEAQMKGFIDVLKSEVGIKQAETALTVLTDILNARSR